VGSGFRVRGGRAGHISIIRISVDSVVFVSVRY
jgi:hypothetical protein